MTDPVTTVVTAAKTDVTAVEVKVETFFAKQVAWLKANWLHLVTMGMTGLVALKTGALGLVKLL